MLNRETRQAVFIIIGYLIVRAFIYRMIPVGSLEDWFYRDLVMCLPRLIGLYFSIKILNEPSAIADLRLPPAYFYGSLLYASYLLELLPKGWAPWPSYMVFVGLGTSWVVGLFEEYLFRGALFSGLLKKFSVIPGVLISSLVFTLYHIQAQPLISWPSIFFVSIVLGNLRVLGLGLLSLSILHGVIDWSYFLFSPTSNMNLFFLGAVAFLATSTSFHINTIQKAGHNKTLGPTLSTYKTGGQRGSA